MCAYIRRVHSSEAERLGAGTVTSVFCGLM